MKINQFRGFSSLLLILVLVLMIGGGYLYFMHNSGKSSSQSLTISASATSTTQEEKHVPILFNGQDTGYSKTSTKVYFETIQIPRADPNTFQVMKRTAKDSTHVYAFGAIIPEADPATFVEIPGSSYIKDKSHVWAFTFYEDASPPVLIEDADPNTFSPILSTQISDSSYTDSVPVISLGKDKNHVYYFSYPISGADPNSFVPLRDSRGNDSVYAKDATHIYAFVFQIYYMTGVDYSTFNVTSPTTAKDQNHNYKDQDISP